ncbi:MAG: hypothetical protein QGH45_10060 [Myxococcota bacterium]|nr:hypothetical protein [Myxococcota bacterium]
MTWRRAIVVLILAAVVPWATLFATNAWMGEPAWSHDSERCTRRCHDRGCPHDPWLPDLLASDEGLYGATILALFEAGRATGLEVDVGYGLANLVLFCAVWPGLMWALLAVALAQRIRLRRLRREG